MSMSHRERVLKALNHEEPDRIPIDLGGTDASGIMVGPYRRLCEHLGLEVDPIYMLDTMQQCPLVHGKLREEFDLDIVFVSQLPKAWREGLAYDGTAVLQPAGFRPEFESDGSLYPIIPDLIEIGVDILNPVQYTASDMEAAKLKREFGSDLCFWGGGIDTQIVLPFGTPDEVSEHVKHRIDDLASGGGFVFATVHNIQEGVPVENILSVFRTAAEYGRY